MCKTCLPTRLLAPYHFHTLLYSEQMFSKYVLRGGREGKREQREIYLIKPMDTSHVFLPNRFLFSPGLLSVIYNSHTTLYKFEVYNIDLIDVYFVKRLPQ